MSRPRSYRAIHRALDLAVIAGDTDAHAAATVKLRARAISDLTKGGRALSDALATGDALAILAATDKIESAARELESSSD